MTASLTTRTAAVDAISSRPRPIPFIRLVRVEWTKATDTRAARWLLTLVALSTTAMLLVPLAAPDFEHTYGSYLVGAALGLSVLLPVVATLLFTSEWSQGTTITTFTQEPRRIRVLNAKLAVSVLLTCGGTIFGAAVATAGIGIATASGNVVDANLSIGVIAGYLLFVLLNVLAGVALGALLQNSAAAITAQFVLPATFATLGTTSHFVSNWIDISTWSWILENDWAGHVPQIAFSIILWIALPLSSGYARTVRRDIA
ncbi:MAG: hypothetical protein H6512_15565 [Acidimicrobiia bacterium]|nr:hypothetical protein [Acidimicrobiia bacterium]